MKMSVPYVQHDYSGEEGAGFEHQTDADLDLELVAVFEEFGGNEVEAAFVAVPELQNADARMLRRYLDGMRRIEIRPVCRQRAPRRARRAVRSAAKKATASASDGSDPEPDGPRVVLTFAAEDDPSTRERVVAALAELFREAL